jgi:hypothetical protein
MSDTCPKCGASEWYDSSGDGDVGMQVFICGTYIRKCQTTMGYACMESQLDKANDKIEHLQAELDKYETLGLNHFLDTSVVMDALQAENEKLRATLQQICDRYCAWYDRGEFYGSASEAAYGIYMFAGHALHSDKEV